MTATNNDLEIMLLDIKNCKISYLIKKADLLYCLLTFNKCLAVTRSQKHHLAGRHHKMSTLVRLPSIFISGKLYSKWKSANTIIEKSKFTLPRN